MSVSVVTSLSIDGALIYQFEKNGQPVSVKNPVTPSEIRELIDLAPVPTIRKLIIIVGMPLPLVAGVVAKVSSPYNAVGVYMNKEQKVMIVWSKLTTQAIGDIYNFKL